MPSRNQKRLEAVAAKLQQVDPTLVFVTEPPTSRGRSGSIHTIYTHMSERFFIHCRRWMVAGDHNVSVAAADLRISSKVPAIMPVLSIIAASIVYEIDGSLRDPDGEFAASPEQTGLDLAEERLRILKAYADGHFTDDPKVIAHATRIHSRAEPRVYEGREASKSAARAS